MKVLQINAVYKTSSTGRTCKELHDYLVDKGIECITAYGEKKSNEKDTVYIGNIFDHKVHAFLSRFTGKTGYFSTFATFRFLKYIKKYNPDVVHIRTLHSNFINIPMLLKYLGKHNIPTVVTLHDCFWFTGKCCHYTINKCYKWQTQCGDCAHFKEWNKVWFFDRTKKLQTDKIKYFGAIKRLGVVGVSNWITEQAKESAIFKSAPIIKRIYNWVDLNSFKPQGVEKDICIKQKLGIADKFVVLGVASYWDKKKGLDKFITLAGLLDKDSVIVLVGHMDSNENLPNNVISVSTTNNVQELVDYYSMADVFMQLSLEESFGKVVAEAVSCGTPAIVYDSTANSELVTNGCGFTVDKERGVEVFLERILEVKKNGKNFYTVNCTKKARESFDLVNNCRSNLELYKEVISIKEI